MSEYAKLMLGRWVTARMIVLWGGRTLAGIVAAAPQPWIPLKTLMEISPGGRRSGV